MSAPPGESHESSAAVDAAALWLGTHWFEAERPLIPFLRRRFKLSALDAVQVLREASRMQRGGADATS